MSSLANTTWSFTQTGATGPLGGTIFFQQVGPSQNAGVATITATVTPVGYTGPTIFTGAWAEVADGNLFAVQLANFVTPQNFNPPPVGVPTINAGQIDAQLVTLFGSHADGIASVVGTNFQTACVNGHVAMSFAMSNITSS